MNKASFTKSFTQQEPIPAASICNATSVLQGGRLHRYNEAPGETSETALWEKEYAAYQGSKYCLATTSGGTAMQIALRAVGVASGQPVLTNAFTLAPVPGAIASVGAVPVFVESTENLTIDLADLDLKFSKTKARVLMLSHMRGHLADMEALMEIIGRHDAVLLEDCAHTMGASWNGVKSGNFGVAACFSTQTYKHLNSGEGGLLTSNDPDLIAKATLLSGSYMLFERHGAGPSFEHFSQARFDMPNCSSRMDNLRSAILRPQLAELETNIERWNARYRIFEHLLGAVGGLRIPRRPQAERYVGSSFQFLLPDWSASKCQALLRRCLDRGVELKWFGADTPSGFTSRYDSWHYAPRQDLPATTAILKQLLDVRIPLSFSQEDCRLVAQIICEEFSELASQS